MRAAAVAALAVAALLACAASAAAVMPTDPISRIAGNAPGFGGDDGPAVDAQLNGPLGMAVDPQGQIYIADQNNNRIRRIAANGVITTVATLPAVKDVAVGPDGSLYYASESLNQVYRRDPAGGISLFAGTGNAAGGGDGGPAQQADLHAPVAVAADAAGNVYIAERVGARVRKVDPGGTITRFAGTGDLLFGGDGGPATNAQLNNPTDLALAPDGSLLIADSVNNRIRLVAPNGVITTIAGTGTAADATDGCALAATLATQTRLNSPQGVAVDGSGNVYVADTGRNCVRKVDPGGLIRRLAGDGSPDGGVDSGGEAALAMVTPWGLAIEPTGSLLISNNDARVRRVTNLPPVASFGATQTAPLTIAFDGRGSSGINDPIVAHSWAFGDGTTAVGPAPQHVYAAPGTYAVTLTVRDDSGTVASIVRPVNVTLAAAGGLLTPGILNLSKASVVGRYRKGRLRAQLVLQGRSTLAGEAVIGLNRTRGPKVKGLATSASLRLRVPAVGPFTARLRLPARLAPGRYALTASGVAVPGAVGSVSVARPPLGILLRAFGGAALNAPARVLPGTTRRLVCAFDFGLVPAKGLVTTEWRGPTGTSPRSVRTRAARVVGFAAARPGRTLPSGRYTCTLRVKGTKVGSVSIRVR